MKTAASRAKLLRRGLGPALLGALWMASLCASLIACAHVIHQAGVGRDGDLKHQTWVCLGYLSLLLGLFFTALVSSYRRQRNGTLVLEGRELRRDGTSMEVAAPSYIAFVRPQPHKPEMTMLVVPTLKGPCFIEDIYGLSPVEIRDAINASFPPQGALPEPRTRLPGTGHPDADEALRRHCVPAAGASYVLQDRGVRWHLSGAWWMAAFFGISYILCFRGLGTDVVGHLFARLPGLAWPALGLAVTLMVFPLLIILHCDPSRRFASWALITREHLVFVHHGVWIIPVEAVEDVDRLGNRLTVHCANGVKVSFPNALLEREVNLACGLDPDRYIYADEAARLLKCSGWKAWWILLEMRKGGKPVTRKDFLARYPRAHLAFHTSPLAPEASRRVSPSSRYW